MYELTLQNKNGKQLVFNQLGGPFTITEITGLSPAAATINTSQAALLDGEKYNSSKVNMRMINIAFAIETNAEENRIVAYGVVQPKKPITMFYKSSLLDVFIEGYVESFDISHFAKKQIGTITILCPFPYFKAAQEVVNELSATQKSFHFPFASTEEPELLMGYIDVTTNATIINSGSVECGLTFELYATAPVSDPKIYNYQTGEYLELDIDMQAGDLITITTGRGNKKITLLREGETTNIFNSLVEGSTWLTLEMIGSIFVYEVGTGSIATLFITISHYDLYEGV